jgi:aconitate hydratase
LQIDGSDVFDLDFDPTQVSAGQEVSLVIRRADGRVEHQALSLRIDTPVEVEYFRHGGILPYVLRQIIREESGSKTTGNY